jgi:hypothetical protein
MERNITPMLLLGPAIHTNASPLRMAVSKNLQLDLVWSSVISKNSSLSPFQKGSKLQREITT